jgi:hypothetical protein
MFSNVIVSKNYAGFFIGATKVEGKYFPRNQILFVQPINEEFRARILVRWCQAKDPIWLKAWEILSSEDWEETKVVDASLGPISLKADRIFRLITPDAPSSVLNQSWDSLWLAVSLGQGFIEKVGFRMAVIPAIFWGKPKPWGPSVKD